jgi:hypothetical protein
MPQPVQRSADIVPGALYDLTFLDQAAFWTMTGVDFETAETESSRPAANRLRNDSGMEKDFSAVSAGGKKVES